MRRLICFLTALVALGAAGGSTEGQTPTTVWYGGTNSEWTTNGGFLVNWSSSVPNSGSIVGLGNGDASVGIGVGGTNLSIGAGAAAGSIVFYQAAAGTPLTTGSYTVGNSGQNLTVGENGAITVNSNISTNQTFGSNIIGSGNLSISNLSIAGSDLIFNGGINRGTGIINASSAAGTVRFNGNVTAQGVVLGTGAGEVIFGDSSTQTISGGITATGTTVSGLAQINNSLTLETGSVFSPGDGLGAVGNQVITGDLNFNNGSVFQWDLQNIANVNAYDRLMVSGQLGLGETSQSVLNLGVNSFDPMQSWSRTIFSGMTSVVGTFGSISLIGADLGVTASQFSWSVDGSNVNLSFAAVPEPSSLVLLGVAGVAGFWARRKRKTVGATVANA